MLDYRLYQIDCEGHVVGPPRIVQCERDEVAMTQARKYVEGRAIEVWRGGERVGVIPPHGGVVELG